MFEKALVANRGEIAVRVQQTLQAMGTRTVAVYSDSDGTAPHVAMANEAFPLVGDTPGDTYLNIGKLIDAARQSGAQAVHPGYGFLSESPMFARACEEAGLVFIGPPSGVLELMGDKVRAKAVAVSAGAPVLPGLLLERVDGATIEAAASEVGLPLIIKAVAGGGGRGLRRIEDRPGLAAEVESAAREADAAFGDGRLFMERWLPRARHIEVQVLADAQGEVAHLFERDCSIQRRHQKLVEETPAPCLDDALRQRLFGWAIEIAREAGYRNAGTVEFLAGSDGRAYFLEVNARLQVEHPVTEAITGLDLVREQVRIAAGQPLSSEVKSAGTQGHAVECRIYAEDPYRHFAPASGRLLRWSPPSGPGIRVDSGAVSGQEVPVHYDGLLAKVITWGSGRSAALARMGWALRHLVALGVPTTAGFLAGVIAHPDFADGSHHTGTLGQHPELHQPGAPEKLTSLAAALGAWAASKGRPDGYPQSGHGGLAAGPWERGGPWRLG